MPGRPGLRSRRGRDGSTPTLADIFSGARTWPEAIRSGDVDVTGTTAIVNALPRWFLLSPWLPDVRAHLAS